LSQSLADFITEARQRIHEVDPETAAELQEGQEDTLLLDVREPEEFAAGRVPGSVNVPRGLLEGAADPEYKRPHPELSTARDRTVLVACTTGGRSALAAATLLDMGFTDVHNVAGGLTNWLAEDEAFEGELVEHP
jgi:rhodanese-related sulfurtransferase